LLNQKKLFLKESGKTTMFDSNYFANIIANAEVQSSSRYFEKGLYLVEIDNCKFFQNRKRQPRAAVECSVIDSSNPNFPNTSSVSWIVSLDSDSGGNTLKTFLVDLTQANPNKITADFVNSIFVDENATEPSKLSGHRAIVNAYEKPTKSGGVFTKCDWTYFKEGMEAPDFAAMRNEASQQSQSQQSQSDQDSWGQPSDNPIPF
jgi:hypothetical protein